MRSASLHTARLAGFVPKSPAEMTEGTGKVEAAVLFVLDSDHLIVSEDRLPLGHRGRHCVAALR